MNTNNFERIDFIKLHFTKKTKNSNFLVFYEILIIKFEENKKRL